MKKFNPFANLSLKIIALLFATLFWIYIVNIGDPIDERPFRDIQVTIVNEEIITSQGMAYQIIDDTEIVTVMVRAKISLFHEFTASDIVATANLADMDTTTNLVPIEVTVRGVEGIESASASPGNVRIKIEPVAVANFPVGVAHDGNPRDGYVVGDLEVNHPTLQIEGPETLIQSISRVVAHIRVDGMSRSVPVPATVRIYNYEDIDIAHSPSLRILELAEEELMVYVQMLSTRNIALHYNLGEILDELNEGYQLSEISFEPSTVLVSGAPDILMLLPEIFIPTATLGLSGVTGTVLETIDIRPYLPEGTQLVEDNAYRILVSIVVEQIDRRGIEIPARAIPIRHLSESLQIDFPNEQSVTFVFMGGREELDALDIGGQVYLDLLEFTDPGRFTLPVRLGVLDVEGVSIFGVPPTIEIELTLREVAEEPDE